MSVNEGEGNVFRPDRVIIRFIKISKRRLVVYNYIQLALTSLCMSLTMTGWVETCSKFYKSKTYFYYANSYVRVYYLLY